MKKYGLWLLTAVLVVGTVVGLVGTATRSDRSGPSERGRSETGQSSTHPSKEREVGVGQEAASTVDNTPGAPKGQSSKAHSGSRHFSCRTKRVFQWPGEPEVRVPDPEKNPEVDFDGVEYQMTVTELPAGARRLDWTQDGTQRSGVGSAVGSVEGGAANGTLLPPGCGGPLFAAWSPLPVGVRISEGARSVSAAEDPTGFDPPPDRDRVRADLTMEVGRPQVARLRVGDQNLDLLQVERRWTQIAQDGEGRLVTSVEATEWIDPQGLFVVAARGLQNKRIEGGPSAGFKERLEFQFAMKGVDPDSLP